MKPPEPGKPNVGACAIADARRDESALQDETVIRAQRGDLTAYEELYRRHVKGIYGLCMRMTGNPDQAEEFTQQTFTRVWEKLSSCWRQI